MEASFSGASSLKQFTVTVAGTNRPASDLPAMWLLLFWNNTRLLPFHAGFDSKEHLKYIDYIQQHRALPLPTEGLEMYQPPLYYLIAAASLSVCKLSINDPASVVVLRALGAFFGIAQFVLVFLSFAAPASGANGVSSDFCWQLFCQCICIWRIM